jgi:hypothetical protein
MGNTQHNTQATIYAVRQSELIASVFRIIVVGGMSMERFFRPQDKTYFCIA